MTFQNNLLHTIWVNKTALHNLLHTVFYFFGHKVVIPRMEVKVPVSPTTPGLTSTTPINESGIIKSTKSWSASLAAWRVSASTAFKATGTPESWRKSLNWVAFNWGWRRWILYKFKLSEETSPRSHKRGAFWLTICMAPSESFKMPCEFN